MARRHRPRRRTQRPEPEQRAPRRQRAFFGYPSHPPSLGETIDGAIRDLNGSHQLKQHGLRIRPWPELSVSGKRLIDQIVQAIDRSDIAAFDVTYQNSNVAFEMGYSIGTFKRIWLSLDTSIQNSPRHFEHSYTGMLAAGYAPYVNHQELADAFLRDRPWSSLDEYLLANMYQNRAPQSEHPTLLYVKPPFDTDAVIGIRERIRRSVFSSSSVIDDARENAGASLDWYADHISQADAVLVHLLADNNVDSDSYNAKASFVAGLARGFRKELLMLAHAPFTCPIDYQTLMAEHDTSEQCLRYFDAWVESIPLPSRRARRSTRPSRPASAIPQLRDLSLGEPVAENERSRVDDYFVETSAFYEAQDANVSIFIGRRGIGKTASFLALNELFRQEARNHVCMVQPVGYEVDGLIRLLAEDWRTAERGFLIESLWKFLIYTELAASVSSSIESRPAHLQVTDHEIQLVEYIENGARMTSLHRSLSE